MYTATPNGPLEYEYDHVCKPKACECENGYPAYYTCPADKLNFCQVCQPGYTLVVGDTTEFVTDTNIAYNTHDCVKDCEDCYDKKQSTHLVLNGEKGDFQDEFKMCKKGYYVCGITVSQDTSLGQNGVDNVGIDGLTMKCCPAPDLYMAMPYTINVYQDNPVEWQLKTDNCDYGKFVCKMKAGYTGTTFADNQGISGLWYTCCDYDTWYDQQNIIINGNSAAYPYEMSCPSDDPTKVINSAVCGLKVQYDPKAGGKDNTALNGIEAVCCKLGAHEGDTCDANGC